MEDKRISKKVMMLPWFPVIISFALVSVHPSNGVPTKCPQSSTEWAYRERKKGCQLEKTYHCILGYNSAELFEVCMKRKEIPPDTGGCPWISFISNEPYFGGSFSDCPDKIDGCPPKYHSGYFSNQLYLYPMCYISESDRILERDKETTVAVHGNETHANTLANPVTYISKVESSSLTPFVSVSFGVILIFVIAILAAVIVLMTKGNCVLSQKGKQGSSEEEVPFTSHQAQQTNDVPFFDEYLETKDYPLIETAYCKQLTEILEKKNSAWLCGIYGSGKESSVQMYSESCGATLWKFNCSGRPHFRRRLQTRLTGDNFQIADSEENFESAAGCLADQLKSENNGKQITVVFLYNVTADMVRNVNTFAKLLETNSFVKCIASSYDRKIFSGNEGVFSDKNIIITDNGFSQKEAMDFFKSVIKNEKHKDAVAQLCDLFDNLPICLAIAKEIMIQASISPYGLLKEMTENNTSVSKQKMSRTLLPFSYIINLIDSSALDLLSFCQFLHNRYIPVSIFKYLADSNVVEASANSVFTAVERFSLGIVEGQDEDRKLDIHKGIRLYFQKTTNVEDKQQMLEKILETLSYMFCKQQSDPGDHARCVTMLPHAKEAIKQSGDIFKPMSMKQASLVILVCDRTAHTFDRQGYYQSRKKYLQKALDLIYENIIKMNIDDLCKKDNFISKDDELYYKKLARRIANQIDENLMSNQEAENISDFLRRYTLRKHRTQSNIKELTTCLDKPTLNDEVKISGEEHNQLLKLGVIFHGGTAVQTAGNFLIELTDEVMQDYGRMPSTSHGVELDDDDCRDHILIGYHLAEMHLKENVPGNTPLSEFQSTVNGKIELDLQEIEAKLKASGNNYDKNDLRILHKIVDQLETRLTVECRYFVFGIPVSDNKFPDYVLMCRQQLLRCTSLIYKATQIAEDRDKMEDEGKALTEMLLRKELLYSESSQRVKHLVAEHYKGLGKYDDSIELLEALPHFRLKPSDYPLTDLDVHDMAMILELYLLKKEKEKHSSFLKEMQQYKDRTFTDSGVNESFLQLTKKRST